ncbi:MAG: vanadium-dependent haloperoxidase [Chloroflexi bacterium]|nr:MAG: vanadium-dependent haloperoxidase [Chloroflexota bacterium]
MAMRSLERITRRGFLRAAGAGGFALFAPGLIGTKRSQLRADRPSRLTDIVLRWNAAALQGVRNSAIGPPMVSRALAIIHTAIFDAWAAYDKNAVGTRLGETLRRPHREHSLENKNEAISFAAYRAAVDLFPGDRVSVFDRLMGSLGYDPSDDSIDPSTPAGIGNLAAQALLAFRHHDGANQLGDEVGGTGMPYSDYTGFVSVNAPMDIRVPFVFSDVHDPNQWQPLRYVNRAGSLVSPGFVGAHWQRVAPFAMSSSGTLRSPTGPAQYGSGEYATQAQALLDQSAALTDEQKMIAEYWADGPNSELPPGHWDLFAQLVARRDHDDDSDTDVDRDVKLFFALTNAIFDAGICAWDNKCAFVSVRPITAVRYLFRGREVQAWAGPGLGTRTIPGETWFPYQPTTFPTPPFPEYSSGHSNFSAAGAEILKLFTGRDTFDGSVVLPAGSSRVEPGLTPGTPVTLSWATFSDAADQAGISRRYGGIHFEQGDLEARETGRLAARNTWARASTYFDGREHEGRDQPDESEAPR